MALTWEQHQRNIFSGESGGDYDALFGYNNRPDGAFSNVKVSEMSVGDVIDFTNPSGAYGRWVKSQLGYTATPVGAYQVVGTTLRDVVNKMGIDLDTKFDEDTQDKIGQYILKTQGTGAWEGYGKGGASMNNKAVQMTQPQQGGMLVEPEERKGLLAGLLGGQGIGQRLGMSEDFRDKLKMGLLMGSDPRRFAPMVDAIQAGMQERKDKAKLEGKINKTVEWLRNRGREDLAEAVLTKAIDPASAINVALTKPKDDRTALMKEYDLAQKDPKFAELLGLKNAPESPEGLKTLDTEFAKSLGDGGGAQNVSAALQDLASVQTVLDKLEAGEPLTGPLIGSLPESVRAFISPEGVQAQQLVESVVQKNLRAILGGQFAQKEGEQLVKRAYNPQLPPAQNAARLRALGETLRAAAENKIAMTEHFFKNNYSLKGYDGPVGVPSLSTFMSALDAEVPKKQEKSQSPSWENVSVGEVVTDVDGKKYKFLGGNRKNPEAWMEVQ